MRMGGVSRTQVSTRGGARPRSGGDRLIWIHQGKRISGFGWEAGRLARARCVAPALRGGVASVVSRVGCVGCLSRTQVRALSALSHLMILGYSTPPLPGRHLYLSATCLPPCPVASIASPAVPVPARLPSS